MQWAIAWAVPTLGTPVTVMHAESTDHRKHSYIPRYKYHLLLDLFHESSLPCLSLLIKSVRLWIT